MYNTSMLLLLLLSRFSCVQLWMPQTITMATSGWVVMDPEESSERGLSVFNCKIILACSKVWQELRLSFL